MVVVVALVLWLRPGDEASREVAVIVENEPEVVAKPATEPKPRAAVIIEEEPEEEFNPYESEAFKAQLQQVADLYEETSKYPVGSRPIINPDSVREPEPFEFNEVDLPFTEPDKDGNAIRISAATNTYQYYYGDVIEVQVRVSGAPEDTFIGVTGNLSSARGDLPIAIDFQPNGPSLTQFRAQIDSKVFPATLVSPEMNAIINIEVDGKDLLTTVSFRYDQPSAQVVGTQPSRVEGPNLVIPMQVNVTQPGYYFLRAVLEEAATNKPLIELQNEARLNAGNALINLNAHISALQYHQSEGPYRLRSVKLHRGAERGESFDVPASNLQPEFLVQGFPLNNYENEQHVDELSQERLAFLRELGGLDTEQDEDINAGTEQVTEDQQTTN